MPVRKPRYIKGNTIGYFPSLKQERMIAFESTIEHDLICLLEYARDVTSYEEQPVKIDYIHDGRKRSYTPDFRITMDNRTIIAECKPASLVDAESNQRKFSVGREWCHQNSCEFRVFTDEQIRAGCLLQNVQRLLPFARHKVLPQTEALVGSILLRAGEAGMKLDQLAVAVNPSDLRSAKRDIFYLTFHHKITALLTDSLITDATVLYSSASHASQQQRGFLSSPS
jgi:hypothetical protein